MPDDPGCDPYVWVADELARTRSRITRDNAAYVTASVVFGLLLASAVATLAVLSMIRTKPVALDPMPIVHGKSWVWCKDGQIPNGYDYCVSIPAKH